MSWEIFLSFISISWKNLLIYGDYVFLETLIKSTYKIIFHGCNEKDRNVIFIVAISMLLMIIIVFKFSVSS